MIGTPGESRCRDIMRAGGTKIPDGINELYAFATCDGLILLAEAALAGGAADGISIQRGLGTVANGFPTAANFHSGPSLTQMPNAARDLEFQSSCQCYVYRAGLYPI